MTRVVLVTSTHRRHRWVASRLAAAGLLVGVVAEEKPVATPQAVTHPDPNVSSYFRDRDAREAEWFSAVPDDHADLGVGVHRCAWSGANADGAVRFVEALAPDRIVLFGSSIIRDPLLTLYAGRMINMHLGLSPYYRGSATNFWPLVDELPECVGVTLHHATLKVDAGRILAQGRPEVAADDDSHAIGCRTVATGVGLLVALLSRAGDLPVGRLQPEGGKLCRRDDFSPQALARLRQNMGGGMLARYLETKSARDACFPIVAQSEDGTPTEWRGRE